jgi:hypothetical protein
MALGGHFDSHMVGGVKVGPLLWGPDWAVTRFDNKRVEGLNLNCAPGEYGHRFTWYFSNGQAFANWRYRFELCPGAEGVSP